MMRLRTLLPLGATVLLAVMPPLPVLAQAAGAPSQLATRLSEVLTRAANGHSPTAEQLAPADPSAPPPDGAAVHEALPLLLKTLENPDAAVRSFGLTTLVQLQSAPATSDPPPAPASSPSSPPEASAPADTAGPAAPSVSATSGPTPAVDALPAAFRPDVAKALAPAIAQIAAHLTDESAANRALTATVLGGFTPNPPASVYPPLIAFLKRDDSTGTTGLAVVNDLLQLGPISDATAAALTRYLGRSDQTADSRSNLIDAISTHANQSQAVNKAMLRFLNTDDPGVRARLILSLPQLDLAQDVYADAHSRVETLAADNQGSLQVVNAAKAVATCWTSVRMASGCPAY